MLRSAAHSHRGYETEVIFGAACSRFRASGPVLHSLPPSPALRRPAEKIVRERELGSKTQPPKRVLHHNTQSKCTRKTHSDRRTPVSVRSILFRLSLWSSWSFCDLRYCRCMKNSWTSLASFRSRRRTQTSTSFTRLKASGQLPSLFTSRVYISSFPCFPSHARSNVSGSTCSLPKKTWRSLWVLLAILLKSFLLLLHRGLSLLAAHGTILLPFGAWTHSTRAERLSRSVSLAAHSRR